MHLSRNRVFIQIFILPFIILVSVFEVHAQKQFSIIALGDMPYHNPADFPRFARLIQAVNKFNPLFSVHVGDIKSGQTDCNDAYYYQIKDFFMQFKGPLIYTPGDNDWTDCNRAVAGNYNPLERLQKVRSVFYDGKKSLGKKPLPTYNQSQVKDFEKYIENQYWEHNGVSFGTIHAVGTNNNFIAARADNQEFQERDTANLNWLDYIFDESERKELKGIVIFTQAAMNFNADSTSGHYNLVQKLRTRVEKFKKPVLLVYGDFHRFLIDKPLRATNGKLLTNFTSLMVFGESEMHAVRIDIDPKKDNLFNFSEFWVKGN